MYPRIKAPKVAPMFAPAEATAAAAPALNLFSPTGPTRLPPPPKGTVAAFVPTRYQALNEHNTRSFFRANNRGFIANTATRRKRAPLPKKMEEMGAEPVAPNRAIVTPTPRPTIHINSRRRRGRRNTRRAATRKMKQRR